MVCMLEGCWIFGGGWFALATIKAVSFIRTPGQQSPSHILPALSVAVEIQGDISGLVYPDLRCGPSPNNDYMTLTRAASWGFQLNHFKEDKCT